MGVVALANSRCRTSTGELFRMTAEHEVPLDAVRLGTLYSDHATYQRLIPDLRPRGIE